jgi:hypothetical protein
MKAFADRCMAEYDLDGWQADDLRIEGTAGGAKLGR